MAVREVSHRGGNMIGHFPSLKLRRMVAFESLIEQDCLYVLDYERDVAFYEEQPLTVDYVWEGKARHYTPDFHVERVQAHELIECKPHSKVDTEENQRKFAAARAWCQANGWIFRVITDQALRTGPRLANIKLLTRYARLEVDPAIALRVTGCLQKDSPLTLEALATQANPADVRQGMAALLHLAFHHQLNLDLTTEVISPRTRLSLP
jgi:hypothetical protein